VAVTLEGRDEPLWVEAGSCHRDCVVEIPCPARPLRLDVDPAFDVMRRLDPLEVPPALSTVFGAAIRCSCCLRLPRRPSGRRRELAAAWAQPEAGSCSTASHRDAEPLPDLA
jgi:hypothetical protein